MQKEPLELTIREIIAKPQDILKILETIAQFDYNLGLKIGYYKGRRDEKEGKKPPPEIERQP